jgi:hypothetical protein
MRNKDGGRMDSAAILNAAIQRHQNRTVVARKRGRPFEKGNPGGRRPKDAGLKELLLPHVPEVVRNLVRVATDSKSRDHVRAINSILDRCYGTPTQMIQADLTITNALAEIDARIIEHDPTWVPFTQAPERTPEVRTERLSDGYED